MRGEITVKNYAIDKDGFVTVRGKRVANSACGRPLKFEEFARYNCQICKDLNIPIKQKVVMRYESTAKVRFYWTTSTEIPARYCEKCRELYPHNKKFHYYE